MKRLEDVLQKWTFEELDSLFDSEMPYIYNYVPGKSIESLCPFDGISVLARQLRRLWTLLSKLPIVEPIFQQFFLDRLAGRNELSKNFRIVLKFQNGQIADY